MSFLGTVADVANLGLSLVNAKKNRDFAREQATTAYNRQIELMNMQNEYNSPAAQMQRFVDAGLNPNLVYGQLQNGLSAPSVAAGSAVTADPQLQLSNSAIQSQIDVAKAQARNLDSSSDLNAAQAYQIYKITPVQFEKIQNDSNRIKQLIDAESFEAFKNRLLTESAQNNGSYTFVNENGDLVTDDLKSLIMDNGFKSLYASNLEYDKAIQLFYTKIGLIQGEKYNLDLTNRDLEAFVDVCAQIYNGQASQASYMGAIADMNKEFYGKLGASNDVIKLIYGFLSLFLGGGIRIDRSTHRSVNSKTTNVFN